MKSGLSAIPFDTLFEVDSQQMTRGHTWKIFKHRSNLDTRKYFFSEREVVSTVEYGINWNKQTLTVEASMVSRTN